MFPLSSGSRRMGKLKFPAWDGSNRSLKRFTAKWRRREKVRRWRCSSREKMCGISARVEGRKTSRRFGGCRNAEVIFGGRISTAIVATYFVRGRARPEAHARTDRIESDGRVFPTDSDRAWRTTKAAQAAVVAGESSGGRKLSQSEEACPRHGTAYGV